MKNLMIWTAATLALTMGCKTAEPAADDATTETSTETSTETPVETNTSASDSVAAALAHPARTDDERARDASRHPAETLAFFGVQPDHEVLELWAGRGWYTHVLAPYLAGSGKLHISIYPQDSEKEYRREMSKDVLGYLAVNGFAETVNAIPIQADALDFGLIDQVDVVLTFRNIHNWVKGGYDAAVYAQAFKALKPGGVFGVVEHRGPEGMTREQSATSGYMDQAQVIADIEAAGFTFVEASEVNANPADTKNHPKGVWTLPPSLRLGDTDRDKYVAIGESDRMTLKFIKPE